MQCPTCDNASTVVLQTRTRYDHGRWPRGSRDPGDLDIRRRRKCPACGFRFTTYESLDMTVHEYGELLVERNGRTPP